MYSEIQHFFLNEGRIGKGKMRNGKRNGVSPQNVCHETLEMD